MTSKLELYNDALLHLGEKKLTSLATDTTARRALDDAYDVTLKYCLEQGFWNFAHRVVQIDSSASVTPTFGYSFAFVKPSDWIRTYTFSSSENFNPPLFDVVDEAGYWYTDCDPLYVKYISNASAYGGDLSAWPQTFANYVATRLALRTCKRITGSSEGVKDLVVLEKRAKADAGSKDAMNEPPKMPPTGTWVRSRFDGIMTRSRWNGTTN